MNQCEGGKLTREDRKELEKNIKEIEHKIEFCDNETGVPSREDIRELRKLRRLR